MVRIQGVMEKMSVKKNVKNKVQRNAKRRGKIGAFSLLILLTLSSACSHQNDGDSVPSKGSSLSHRLGSKPHAPDTPQPERDPRSETENTFSHKKVEAIFYQKFFKLNSIVQLVSGAGEKEASPSISLDEILRDVQNKDFRRLIIPYKISKDHSILIALNQKTGRIIHQDPMGKPIDPKIRKTLQTFYDTYLTKRFHLAKNFDSNFEDFQLDQKNPEHSEIATLINIEDLLKTEKKAFAKVDLTLEDLDPSLIRDKKKEYEDLNKGYSHFLSSHHFPGTYHKINPEFVFPVRSGGALGGFKVFQSAADPVCDQERKSQKKGNHNDPINRDLIRAVRSSDAQTFPYEDYYQAKDAVDPYWATTPPFYVAGHNRQIYPPVNQLPKVNAYVFRQDTRDYTEIALKGGFAPKSSYTDSINDAYGTVTHFVKGKKVHFEWLGEFDRNQGFVSGHPVGIALPDVGWVNPAIIGPAPVDAHKLAALRNSFYDFTVLNPYIHMVTPVAKAMISTTRSPIVARGFAKDGIVYVVYAQGFQMPHPLKAPWNSQKEHPYYNRQEQEVTVPGFIPEENIAGYAASKDGKFEGDIYIRDGLEYDDPEAFEKIYHSLCGK